MDDPSNHVTLKGQTKAFKLSSKFSEKKLPAQHQTADRQSQRLAGEEPDISSGIGGDQNYSEPEKELMLFISWPETN